jgi:hypothetical protein
MKCVKCRYYKQDEFYMAGKCLNERVKRIFNIRTGPDHLRTIAEFGCDFGEPIPAPKPTLEERVAALERVALAELEHVKDCHDSMEKYWPYQYRQWREALSVIKGGG